MLPTARPQLGGTRLQEFGAKAHALDYDDVTEGVKGHHSVALPEEEGVTDRQGLLAYIVGFEVAGGVGDAMSPSYADDGFITKTGVSVITLAA